MLTTQRARLFFLPVLLIVISTPPCSSISKLTAVTVTPLPTPTPDPVAAEAAAAELETLFYTSQNEQGMQAADEILARDPDNATALAIRAGLRLRADDLEGANADLTQALELDPNNAYALAARAGYLLQNDDQAAASEVVERALAINPDLPYAKMIQSQLLIAQNAVDAGLAARSRAIDLRPDYVIALRERGILYYWTYNDPDAALADSNRALEITPDAWAYNTRANIYQWQGSYEAAMDDHNRAIELDPDQPDFYYYRGYTYLYQEEVETAIADFDHAIELSDLAAYHEIRGYAYYELGRFDAASDDAHQMAALAKGDLSFNNSAAYLLALMNRELDQAAEYVGEALADSPEDRYYLETRAYIYFLQGDVDTAREMYTSLVEDEFTYGYYGLGLVQQADGDDAAAAESFRAFLEEHPDEYVSDDARERLESLGG